MNEAEAKVIEAVAENPEVVKGAAEVIANVKPKGKTAEAVIGFMIIGGIAIAIEHGVKWTVKGVKKLWGKHKAGDEVVETPVTIATVEDADEETGE